MATVSSLAELVGGTVVGDAGRSIVDLADLSSAGPEHVSFLANPKYAAQFEATRAGAVLVATELPSPGAALIIVGNPYLAMARIATHLHPAPSYAAGTEPGAMVHPEAQVHASATVRLGAVVEAGAVIGARSVVGAGAYVGPRARLGDDVVLHPGVRVLERCVVGSRVILHAGVVVGADGFGYAPDLSGKRHKIPQVGIVVIEDDVEIGANTTVDRATFGETRIGRGTKIDNLVQVAHNVRIGEDSVLVAQVGLAGSSKLGNRVVVGGQSAVVGHVSVADDVMLGARSGVANDIEQAGVYSGVPAMPHRQWLKSTMVAKNLPELRSRVQKLEQRLAALENVPMKVKE